MSQKREPRDSLYGTIDTTNFSCISAHKIILLLRKLNLLLALREDTNQGKIRQFLH